MAVRFADFGEKNGRLLAVTHPQNPQGHLLGSSSPASAILRVNPSEKRGTTRNDDTHTHNRDTHTQQTANFSGDGMSTAEHVIIRVVTLETHKYRVLLVHLSCTTAVPLHWLLG